MKKKQQKKQINLQIKLIAFLKCKRTIIILNKTKLMIIIKQILKLKTIYKVITKNNYNNNKINNF